jgi:hypothetical protein
MPHPHFVAHTLLFRCLVLPHHHYVSDRLSFVFGLASPSLCFGSATPWSWFCLIITTFRFCSSLEDIMLSPPFWVQQAASATSKSSISGCQTAEGKAQMCIAHGGGRRCKTEGCTHSARGSSGLCIRHGGGKRCQRENCLRSAEGHTQLCISHGGGLFIVPAG